jgi:protein-L-isoaspartate(D-aspartate) O-methyltransferase
MRMGRPKMSQPIRRRRAIGGMRRAAAAPRLEASAAAPVAPADHEPMPMRRALLRFLAFSGLVPLVDSALARGPDYAEARARMLREIESDFRATASDTGVSAPSPALRRALAAVPRERFVPPKLATDAYDNNPLPIGEGQTISQPFIVALMTELLKLPPGARVLEVGTGSGYQAAILAEMGMRVYSIEIVAPLAERARVALDAAGYAAVVTRIGDGYKGWPDAAPFDGIIVTAAPDHVPPALVEQLKPGGRMVIPVGPNWLSQELRVIRKETDGRTVTQRTLPVRFVPLTRAR